MNVSTATVSTAGRLARWPAAVALAFGLIVVYGAGFAYPTVLHNATHDMRHAFGLPCH